MGDVPAAGAGEKEKGGKGKLIAIIAVAVIVVLGGGGAAAYFTGMLDFMLPRKHAKSATIELAQPVTHQLPQIKADLKTDRCKSALLRTTIVIQLGAADLPRLQTSELRVIDSVRSYLRDQERQDLVGKQGTDKLRTDLTTVVNGIIAPASIHSMLFKELVLQ
jgi:flagellar FliL protein